MDEGPVIFFQMHLYYFRGCSFHLKGYRSPENIPIAADEPNSFPPYFYLQHKEYLVIFIIDIIQ